MKKFLIVCGVVLLLIVIAMGAWVGVQRPFDEENTWPSMPFDTARWKATSESDRYVMVRDLIEKRTLTGLNRAAVVTLLGQPGRETDDRIIYLVKRGSDAITFNMVFYLDVFIDGSSGNVVMYNVRGN